MSTTTTNYGFVKPEVGGDPLVWGSMYNSTLDSIDTVLSQKVISSGGTELNPQVMTGPLNVPDVALGDNSQKVANTKFVKDTFATRLDTSGGTVENLTVTGTCTVPDLPLGDNSSKLVNTKFVKDSIDNYVSGLSLETPISDYHSGLEIRNRRHYPSASESTDTNSILVMYDRMKVTDGISQKVLSDGKFYISPSEVFGLNGLDTGVLTKNQWYSVWVIHNPTTNSTGAILSAMDAISVSTTSGSAIVTGVPSTSKMRKDLPVMCANFDTGTKILSVDSPTQLTMNKNSVATGVVELLCPTLPLLPTGYTMYQLVGYQRTDNSSTIPFLLGSVQYSNGETYWYIREDKNEPTSKVFYRYVSGNTYGTSYYNVILNSSTPPGATSVKVQTTAESLSGSRNIGVGVSAVVNNSTGITTANCRSDERHFAEGKRKGVGECPIHRNYMVVYFYHTYQLTGYIGPGEVYVYCTGYRLAKMGLD